MSESSKVTPFHLQRQAVVYVRQSTASQVENNQESTQRQYALAVRAEQLGWAKDQVTIIDEDLGLSGSGSANRAGFARLTTEVALGQVGIVLGLEVSRLARNNADWYRLLDLCGITDTLIGDGDGLYHPSSFNDRLVLGLKGTMSEAELHVLRARLNGGIRNKAERGELRRGLPVGFIWGDGDGEILLDADESVVNAIRNVFQRFLEFGSARRTWLWFLEQEMCLPNRRFPTSDVQWVTATYHAIHMVLTNPTYAGAYAYGRTKRERYVDDGGRIRQRMRHQPREQWSVLIHDHHPGYVDWDTYLDIQTRLATNTRPKAHEAGGAVREGSALLQGLASCGTCGRRLHVAYQGDNSVARYYCGAGHVVNGRGARCLSIGGARIEKAVAKSFLAAMTPAGMEAAVMAIEQIETDFESSLKTWRLEVERARYEAQRAERRYRAVDPDNRLVARGLESEWEQHLRQLAKAEAALAEREQRRPRSLTQSERDLLATLGRDLALAWDAPTTTNRDRKELMRLLIEEIVIKLSEDKTNGHLVIRWKGGATTELDVDTAYRPQPTIKTDEDTIDLLRRLAIHYKDEQIAGILNRQGRLSARGERFTAVKVQGLRYHRGIPPYEPNGSNHEDGELLPLAKAAKVLGIATSTLHRWIGDGFVPAEQPTPGAPWHIRVTDELKSQFVEEAPAGWVTMWEAMKALRVSRQTVLQRVKRGELRALHLRIGRRKGLRIELPEQDSGMDSLFSGELHERHG
ncbi:MAG TPA: recombinase family protein [Candidatus Micrarchaeaceae archaeon]|nr:recombinase family protein [Candidatus Micrarchaeaceae archaeon]